MIVKLTHLVAAHAWWFAIASPCFTAEAASPNIVVIFTDDQGVNDVGCYGSEIATPHIDGLAQDGMRFTQFYAASSICTPSRYGLLTGRYPHRSQDQLLGALMFLADEDLSRGIQPGEETYVSRLANAGYRTALVGKWHLGHGKRKFWPTRHGFDSFFGHTGGCVDFFTLNYGNRPDWYRGESLVETDGYATDVITDEAIRLLRESSSDDKPLYLHISYNAPHFGKGWNETAGETENVMQPKPNDLKLVSGIEDPLRRAFAAKVVGMDKSIGELLAAIDELKMREDTIVVFMTDHGGAPDYGGSNEPLRGGKATLFEGGIRVPCIVRWPGVIDAATVCDDVTSASEWSAIYGDIVGYDPAPTDGISMLPSLRGEEVDQSRTIVWKTGAHELLGRDSWFAVRQGDWKLVDPPDAEPMLFELKTDPNETRDVSGEHPQVLEKLKNAG